MTLESKTASGGIGLGATAHRVLISQVVITVLAAMGSALMAGALSGISALYGGMVAVLLTWLLKRRVGAIANTAEPNSNMLSLYIGVVQRFLLALAMFALALGVLKLDPLPCVISFGLCQFGYVFSRVLHKG